MLGFLTFTVTFFLGLFPGSELGAECAAIFAIFTAQAWNMAFSFYQSLRTVPSDLDECCRHFQLSPWLRFWRLEVPFAAPGLIWNTMMSMSGGWFFVVASEAITVGDTTVNLPGIGSWIALAISRQNLGAVAQAVGVMALVILAYDQFAISADRGVGRQIPVRADRRPAAPELLGLRPRSSYQTATADFSPLSRGWPRGSRRYAFRCHRGVGGHCRLPSTAPVTLPGSRSFLPALAMRCG